MERKEIMVTSYREVVELIKSFDNGNDEMLSIAQQLADVLERIPEESIGEIYAKITEDNLLKMGIRHHNDRFRLVQLLIGSSVVGVTTCMMKDTLNFQLDNGSSFSSMKDMATPYFECVFGNAFEKVITKHNGEVLMCEMAFDDQHFSDRLYVTEAFENMNQNQLESIETDEQRFRYLSFFEVYDYFVKNEIVENPDTKSEEK